MTNMAVGRISSKRGTGRRREYAVLVSDLLAQTERLEADTASDLRDGIDELRRRVLDRVAAVAPQLRVQDLPTIEAEILAAVAEWENKIGNKLFTRVEQAFMLGAETGGAAIVAAKDQPGLLTEATVGIVGAAPLVPISLLDVLKKTTASLVQNIAEETRRKIVNEVRAAAGGVKEPFEAQQAIARELTTRRQPGSPAGRGRKSIADRSDKITRTELNRVFSVANFEAMKKSAEVLPGSKKQWLTTIDGRERGSHRNLHLQSIAINKKFKTPHGGLMFPLDPQGPVEEIARCRCVLTLSRPDWEEPIQPPRATDKPVARDPRSAQVTITRAPPVDPSRVQDVRRLAPGIDLRDKRFGDAFKKIDALDQELIDKGRITGKSRERLVKEFTKQGIPRDTADRIVLATAGKPELRARLRQAPARMKDKVKVGADKLVKPLVKEGVPLPVAKAVATTAAVLGSTPLSVTSVGTGFGILGPWGLTPGLGQAEGAVVYGGTLYGAKAVNFLRRVAGKLLTRRLVAATAKAEPGGGELAGTPGVTPAPELATLIVQNMVEEWNEGRRVAFAHLVGWLVLSSERSVMQAIEDAKLLTNNLTPAEEQEILQAAEETT